MTRGLRRPTLGLSAVEAGGDGPRGGRVAESWRREAARPTEGWIAVVVEQSLSAHGQLAVVWGTPEAAHDGGSGVDGIGGQGVERWREKGALSASRSQREASTFGTGRRELHVAGNSRSRSRRERERRRRSGPDEVGHAARGQAELRRRRRADKCWVCQLRLFYIAQAGRLWAAPVLQRRRRCTF